MRHLLAAVVVTAVVAAVAGCSDDDGLGAGEAAVEIAEGSRVLVAEPGGDLALAEGRESVRFGAEVKVLAGSATVSLAGGSRLEVRDGSELTIGAPLSLVAGDLLVTSGRAPVEVDAAGSGFTVEGVAQLSRDLAVSASSYRGSVTLRSAARVLRIPSLREAAVASLGVVPAAPRPLTYDPTDSWDRRFLAEAIELGDQLEAKSRGFTESVGRDQGRTAGFYRVLLPSLEEEPQFDESLLRPGLPPGETLVGATIALHGSLGSFADRWAAVFDFRAQDAPWGLVALDQQVDDPSDVVETVNLAIGRQGFAFAPARPPGARPPAAVPPPAPSQPPVTSAPPPPPRTSPPPPTAPPARPDDPSVITVPTLPPLLPPSDPGDPPSEGLLAPLVNVVTATLDGLLGGSGSG
ncbi:MAG: hypothetical protein ACLGIO_06865 [Acidimicrobiia bacterium]